MSGFELEHRSVSDKFERNQQAFKSSKDDSNRALLESLKRSANIAQDLASLYSERPYVYARVMMQLSGVLGAARVRRLHTTVQDNARRIAEVQRAEAEKAAKKSLHKKSADASKGSASSGQTTDMAPVEDAEKEYNIQLLGVSTKVKVSSENGTHTIKCSEWNIPYLKSIRGSATVTNAELSNIRLDASLEVKHLKRTQVTLEFQKINGKFEPRGGFSTAVDMPGLEAFDIAFKFAKDGNMVGEISLQKNINIDKEGKFKLGKGSKGTASIVHNELQTIDGTLIVIIDGPKTDDGQSKSRIRATAKGTLNFTKDDKVEIANFSAKAKLVSGALEIAKGLSVTKLNADINIKDNHLQKISGGAGIKYENKGFVGTGEATFEWEKAKKEGGKDKIGFNGQLGFSAFEGKLSGNVGVDYKSYKNEGTPEITGKLFFKITDWLGGEIGVRFEKGWEDPVVDGSIKVTDVELLAARKLFGFGKDLGAEFPVFTGVTAGVGIGLGLSLDMEAIKFGGTIEISNYHVKSSKGIPDFKTSLNCTTGLAIKAGIKPYVSLGVGAPMFSAGIKIKGGAEFKTTASADINGELRGGEKGLGGEFGLGVEVTGEFSVAVTPSFYVNALGASFNKDMHTWEFNLGELFNFTWGKKVVWDQSGTRLEEGAKTVPMTLNKTKTAAEGKKNGVSEFKSGGKTAKAKEGAPKLPGAEELGKQALGKTPDKPEEADKGFAQRIEQAKKIAKALGSIGNIVGLIKGMISSASVAGPLGVIAYVAIKVIKGELRIDTFKNAVKDVKAGIEAIKELLADKDLMKSILPDWAYEIYDFLSNNDFDAIKKKVLDTLKEKFKEKGSPLSEILQPVLKFVANRLDAIGDILMLFKEGGVASIVKGIFKILGFSLSSIGEVVKMGKDMLKILGALVKVNVQNGNIYVQCIEHGFFGFNEYWWKFCIPGLCNWSGSTEKDGKTTSVTCNGLLAAFGGYGLHKTPRKSPKDPSKKGGDKTANKSSKEPTKKEK